jgi:hypothetical protein
VFLEAIVSDDRGIGQIAEDLGWSEQACYHYREGKTSPSFDKVIEAARRRRMPAALQLHLLLLLSDGCYLIMPAPEIDGEGDPPPDQAARLRALVREGQREMVLLGERVDAALEDRRVCAQDLASINEPGHRIRRILETILAAAGGMFRRGRGVR